MNITYQGRVYTVIDEMNLKILLGWLRAKQFDLACLWYGRAFLGD